MASRLAADWGWGVPSPGADAELGPSCGFPVGRADPSAVDQMAPDIPEGGSARSKPPSNRFP